MNFIEQNRNNVTQKSIRKSTIEHVNLLSPLSNKVKIDSKIQAALDQTQRSTNASDMWFQGSKFVSVKDEEIPKSKLAMKRVSYA